MSYDTDRWDAMAKWLDNELRREAQYRKREAFKNDALCVLIITAFIVSGSGIVILGVGMSADTNIAFSLLFIVLGVMLIGLGIIGIKEML
jgi:hypothetical protein